MMTSPAYYLLGAILCMLGAGFSAVSLVTGGLMAFLHIRFSALTRYLVISAGSLAVLLLMLKEALNPYVCAVLPVWQMAAVLLLILIELRILYVMMKNLSGKAETDCIGR